MDAAIVAEAFSSLIDDMDDALRAQWDDASIKAVSLLECERRIVRAPSAPTGYAFDNPYFRGWVIRNGLKDIGLALPETSTP